MRDSRVAKQLLMRVLLSSCMFGLSGCRGTPLFNVLGSFFPAWMVCLIAALVLTLLVRWLFRRIDFERNIRPLVIVYPALVTLFTCTIWLLFFS